MRLLYNGRLEPGMSCVTFSMVTREASMYLIYGVNGGQEG